MASYASKKDVVVEIGGGDGALTMALTLTGATLRTIEIDSKLAEGLRANFPSVEVVEGNALKVSFKEYNKVIASIPYQITEPLIEKLAKEKFDEAILLTGDNFYFTCIAKSEDPSFGKLTLLANSYFKIELVQMVGKESFDPEPRTKSALIKLTPAEPSEESYKVIRFLLERRKKKIKNGLIEYLCGTGHTKNQAKEIVKSAVPESIFTNYLENLNNGQIKELFLAVKKSIDTIKRK